MGWFEKFTLFCVVLVIASLSCILIASVQLLHRPDDGINRDNLALLQRFRALRALEPSSMHRPANPASSEKPHGSPPVPLLAIIIRSSKSNYALRKVIRQTWARGVDYRLVHKFVLVGSKLHNTPSGHGQCLSDWLARLNRRRMSKSARYFLFVDETVFVNTRFVLEALEHTLPTKEFILCTPNEGPQSQTSCDVSRPVLVSGDVARNSLGKGLPPLVHDGKRLYLSRRDTEAVFHHQIVDIRTLLYFFSAPTDRLFSSTMPPLHAVQRLWEAMYGNFTTIES